MSPLSSERSRPTWSSWMLSPEHADVDGDDTREEHGKTRSRRRRRRGCVVSGEERVLVRERPASFYGLRDGRHALHLRRRRPQADAARGFDAVSAAGRTGFGVRMRSSGSAHRTQTGSSGGHVPPARLVAQEALRDAVLERMEAHHGEAPARAEHLEGSGRPTSSDWSSWLTSMRSAWKTRFAKCPSQSVPAPGSRRGRRPRAARYARSAHARAGHDAARDLARVALFAVAAEDHLELPRVPRVHDPRPRRARPTGPCACRAARPSRRRTPRSGRSTCIDERPRSGGPSAWTPFPASCESTTRSRLAGTASGRPARTPSSGRSTA